MIYFGNHVSRHERRSPTVVGRAKQINGRVTEMTSNIIESTATVSEDVVLPEVEGEGAEVPYDSFVEILQSGKYAGELWAEMERDKIRAQVEVRFASTRNNETRLQSATDKLSRAVSEQKTLETEFSSAQMWGKYFISTEAVTAKQAENNTPKQ